MNNREDIILALKLAAAKTAKLAKDFESNRLWEGELSSGISEALSALNDAKRLAGNS